MTSFFGCDISNDGQAENLIIDPKSALEIFAIMTPKRSPYPLIRIGGSGDGAYLIPNDLSQVGHCLSPGVNNFKHFEDELTTKFDIKCDMYDASSDVNKLTTPLIEGKQTFQKLWLDIDNKPDSISIEQWLASKSPESGDCILQMDIEGAEYEVINSCPGETLKRFRIIVAEFHYMDEAVSESSAIHEAFSRLAQNHVCVHAHPNNCCGDFFHEQSGMNVPRVVELSFLRNDRFMQPERHKLHNPSLPNFFDITSNLAPSFAPLHLNEAWLSPKKRSLPSKLKAALDKAEYYAKSKTARVFPFST